MKMSHANTIRIGLIVLTLPAWTHADDDAQEQLNALKAHSVAKIGIIQAVETATKKVPGGKVVQAELELENGKPVYEVELIADGKFVEVEIDAVTGQVLEAEKKRARATYSRFDKDKTGKVPQGWSIRQTRPTKTMATWQVVADQSAPSKGNVMALTRSENYNGTYNLATADASSFKNLDLSVKTKAVKGEEDQGGGPIWRCRDQNNYYICRFNPLESNYRVYIVKNKKRKQLQSYNIKTEPGKWYTLRVTMAGDHITCYLDGKKMLEVKDQTFKEAGMVGLWTKADAVTSFDDLEVRELRTSTHKKNKDRKRHDHDHDDHGDHDHDEHK
ncbi:MAG: PepSY domain-containing protein [Planctomycetota bacterium]